MKIFVQSPGFGLKTITEIKLYTKSMTLMILYGATESKQVGKFDNMKFRFLDNLIAEKERIH